MRRRIIIFVPNIVTLIENSILILTVLCFLTNNNLIIDDGTIYMADKNCSYEYMVYTRNGYA